MVASGQSDTVTIADDELLEHYLGYTGDALSQLDGILATLTEGDTAGEKGEALHAIAHNIKGMGSSFGFPMMTNIGALMCSYLRALDTDETLAKDVVEAHVKAMHVVLDSRITGDGDETGAKLLARLEELIATSGAA